MKDIDFYEKIISIKLNNLQKEVLLCSEKRCVNTSRMQNRLEGE